MNGKRFVVTGGAGYIGLHLCFGLAEAGAQVLCVSSKMPASLHPNMTAVECEIGRNGEFEAALKAFGPVDGLINCAGRLPRHADVAMAPDALSDGLRNSVGVAFACLSAAVKHMPNGGSLVTLGSLWGQVSPSPEVYLGLKIDPSYATSAAAGATTSLVRHLAVTLAPHGVRVNALVPGWFPRRSGPERADYMHEITIRVPLGRIGHPQELIGPASFLLSDASSYMTGQSLIVDGGYSAR